MVLSYNQNQHPPKMPWIQMKYGIAIVYAGLLALAFDQNNSIQYVFPVCVGLTIVVVSFLAQRLEKANGKAKIWHFSAMQLNFMLFVLLVFVAGRMFNRLLTATSVFFEISLLALSLQCLFITSDPFQSEHEYLNDPERGE